MHAAPSARVPSRKASSAALRPGRLLRLALAGLLGWQLAGAQAETPREQLRFGVFAYLGLAQTRARYQPLVDYLNATLREERITLEVLPQSDIDRGVAQGQLDIVTTNPTHFLVIRNRFPLTGVIATRVAEVNGTPVHQLAGVIIVAAGRRDIQRLDDVRGKTVATPSTRHMGGYRAQAYELHLAGVKLPQDVNQVLELETHQAVVQAVLDGRAEVGLIREGVLEWMQAQGQIRPDQYRIIHPQQHPGFPFRVSTRLYPEWPVFALPHVSDRAIRHVAAALFALEPDHPAARAAGIHGYTVSADYLQVESLARALRLPPFDGHLDVTWQDIWQTWRQGLTLAAAAGVIILLLLMALLWLAGRERAARARLRLLLETLGEGVYGADQAGRCTFINPAGLQMLGRQEHEVLGQPQQSLWLPEPGVACTTEPTQAPTVRSLQDGQVRRGEAWFAHARHGGFPVEYVASPLCVNRHVTGVVVAFQDIRARKEAERRLHALVDELTAANAALQATRDQLLQAEKLASVGQLAAGVAHEINNPIAFVNANLGTLATYVAQLLELGDLAAQTPAGHKLAQDMDLAFVRQDVPDLLKESRDGLQRVRRIVLDLREFARAGDDAWAEANLHDCIESALNIVGNVLVPKCTVHKDYAELPALTCMSAQLTQVFVNLLLNACEAIASRGDIHIRTESAAPGQVRVYLADTGCGIAPEAIKRIFDPFYTTKPVGQGTGLGLSLVWGMVQRHGGQIEVRSEPGQGACFTITLPIRGPAVAQAGASATR